MNTTTSLNTHLAPRLLRKTMVATNMRVEKNPSASVLSLPLLSSHNPKHKTRKPHSRLLRHRPTIPAAARRLLPCPRLKSSRNSRLQIRFETSTKRSKRTSTERLPYLTRLARDWISRVPLCHLSLLHFALRVRVCLTSSPALCLLQRTTPLWNRRSKAKTSTHQSTQTSAAKAKRLTVHRTGG